MSVTLRITETPRLEGLNLIIKISPSDLPEVRKFIYKFVAGVYEIVKTKQKRSLDANAMMWSICDQVARAVGTTKEDVYKRAVQDVGVYEPLPIKADAVEDFQRRWQSKGTGWLAVEIDDSKLNGYKLVFAYYGSSTYTTSEMSRLLDYIIDDAKSVGIDVISEKDKALLLEAWDVKSS